MARPFINLVTKSSAHKGLSSYEAERLLRKFGENTLAKKKKTRPIVLLLKKFWSPLLVILIIASLISFVLGDRANALIILFMIITSAALDFINTYKSENAAERLLSRVVTTVTVERDGRDRETDLRKIVPGDLVVLSAGDIVPADCEILEADDFFVDQSALTGESFPSEKAPSGTDPVLPDNVQEMPLDAKNFAFMGTSAVTGYARARILTTGAATKFGKIAERLVSGREKSEFEKSIKNFGIFVVKLTVVMAAFVFLANAMFGRGVLESFIFAIAIAIGLTPELLPVILTVSLSRGSVEMSKKDVIVKNLSSIENFGSMSVLCTDKTGTLTKNKITLIKYIDGFGNISERTLLYAYLAGAFHTGVKNPLNSAVNDYKKIDISGYKKIDEVPFDFERKMSSMAVKHGGRGILITEGAPEEIFKIAASYFEGDDIRPLDGEAREVFVQKFQELSRDGFRVLGVAAKDVDPKHGIYKKEDETEMVFSGFTAFLDPPKEGVKEAIDALEGLGVEIKILTGDNEILAEKICRDIGITSKGTMTNEAIAGMSDLELEKKIGNVTIFARTTPEQKEKIISLLKRANNVVGYLGDGINDAPALKAADVSISVNNAVDVAKETADIILVKKSLEVLKSGIVLGRKTFQNTLKYIMMGLSSNFGNMFSMVGASMFLKFLPMLPQQILLNNLLYDSSQFTLATDSVDDDAVQKPPRWDLNFIRNFTFVFGVVGSAFDFLTFGVLLWVFHFGESQFQTGWFMTSFTSQVFVVYIIRTKKIPFLESRPSAAVLVNTLLMVVIGLVVPYTVLGVFFGFTPLPADVFAAILGITAVYLIIAEITKRYFYRMAFLKRQPA